jgi:hypothetical protein
MIVGLWIAAALAVAGAIATLVLRGRRGGTVMPLADVESFAAAVRRTWLRWALVAGALVALLLVFVLRGRGTIGEPPLARSAGNAVVVIDLSQSTRVASPAIARTLSALTKDGRRRLGLVVFSDTAYEALPASTPADGLEGWLQLFAHEDWRRYPWTPSFSSGTVISTGLAVARRMLVDAPARDRHVVLVSDLIDAAPDLQKLEGVVGQYQRDGIDLRIVRVRTGRGNRLAAIDAFPNATFVQAAASLTVDPERVREAGGPLVAMLVLVALLGALAAVYETAFHPFTWRLAR